LLLRQRVRHRSAARHVPELLLGKEVRLESLDRPRQFRRERGAPGPRPPQAPRPGQRRGREPRPPPHAPPPQLPVAPPALTPPPCITAIRLARSSRSEMSARTSPSTTSRSASLPGVTLPNSSPRPMISAPVFVAQVIVSSGLKPT